MRRSPRMRGISELAAPHPYTFPDTNVDSSSESERDDYFPATLFAPAQDGTGTTAPRGSPADLGQFGPRSPTLRSKTLFAPSWLLDPLAPHSSPPLKRRSSIPLPELSPCSTTFRIYDESGRPTYYGTSSLPRPSSPSSSESSALGFTPPVAPAKNTFTASSPAGASCPALNTPPQLPAHGCLPLRPTPSCHSVSSLATIPSLPSLRSPPSPRRPRTPLTTSQALNVLPYPSRSHAEEEEEQWKRDFAPYPLSVPAASSGASAHASPSSGRDASGNRTGRGRRAASSGRCAAPTAVSSPWSPERPRTFL
ncbi:hypothetical protein JCM21900_003674 [Sporobolomyces salmonicolor]